MICMWFDVGGRDVTGRRGRLWQEHRYDMTGDEGGDTVSPASAKSVRVTYGWPRLGICSCEGGRFECWHFRLHRG
jgi:hypothetical protein